MDSQLMLLRRTVHHVHDLQIIIVYIVTTGLCEDTSRKHLTNIHINIMNLDKRWQLKTMIMRLEFKFSL